MAREFFGKHFIGMEISFVEPRPSVWTLDEKIGEDHTQSDEREYKATGDPSDAQATFSCQNVDNPGEIALMKICMQIPYLGSEFDLPEVRAAQAAECTPHSEYRSLLRLTEKGCNSSPTLLAHKQDKQPENALVPSGYIRYFVITRLPGVRLGKSVYDAAFWNMPDATRDRIREAFRIAWCDVMDAGIKVSFPGLKHLLWDEVFEKIYIIGFEGAHPVEDLRNWPYATLTWRNKVLLSWGLAKAPQGDRFYEPDYDDSNMDRWQL